MNNAAAGLLLLALAACGGDRSPVTISPVPVPPGTTAIYAIQGSGTASPLEGANVTISAIVTGDFQDNDADSTRNLGGFYVQQETSDADPNTSDGIFVFDGDRPPVDVNVGDRVEVGGVVAEYFGETQINATSVSITGTGSMQPTDVNLPAVEVAIDNDGEPVGNLEAYEGMLVRFPQKLVVSSLRFLESYGEVGLAQGGRPFQFTNSNLPDALAYSAHVRSLAARSVILDDGLRESYAAPVRYLHGGDTTNYSIRVGDSISGATGNLRYSRGSGGGGPQGWRLEPVTELQFQNDNARPGKPVLAGSIRVASFNVLNFFSDVDTGQPICGPGGASPCRGADSALELSRQLAKTVTAIAMMEADVIGLIELENNASASITMLVDALNIAIGSGNYAYVDTGAIHTDAIKTGFIYNASRVQPAGPYALLDASVDPRFRDNLNRPTLAQTFDVIATGARVTIVVNHLKSKGSACDASGDPNTGDGQGNCNAARTDAAAAIADWIKTDPTASSDPDFLVIGDMNAYFMEDPLTTFRNAGLSNLLDGNPNAYSYQFDGQAGALDHALASPDLAAQVRATLEWHINADEPEILDYNLEDSRDSGLFDPNIPYRASDHDPVLIGLDLTN
jgi:predicted extracellular nuclease